MLFGVIGYCYKPDTSIQTWALEEARRRLEIEGQLLWVQPAACLSVYTDISAGILADPDAKSS